MERVADHDYEILYKSGKENVVVDALSRIHINAFSSLLSNSIQKSFITGYRKDSFKSLIKEVEEKKGTFTRYTIENKLLYCRIDEYEPWRLRIPNISYRNIVIHENHDLSIAGHSGFVQIYSKIARSYYWPGMSKDIRKHVKECDAYQRTKASNQSPVGELHPLPIPQRSLAINRNGLPRISICVKKRQ